MRCPNLRFLLAAFAIVALSASLPAQQTGGGTTGGGATGGGTTGGGTTGGGTNTGRNTGTSTGSGSTIGTPSSTGAGGSMDATQAFSAVERGDSVAATGNTGAGFSFASSANQGAAGGAGGLGGLRGLGGGGMGGLGGLSSLFGGLNSQSQQNTRPPVRTRLRSAVIVAPHSPELVQRRAGQRIQAFAQQPELGGVIVTMEGRRAIVSGVVVDDRQRRMSELLLRLEPGVSEIDNRLEVAGP